LKILVIGSSGFIGSNCADKLRNENINVVLGVSCIKNAHSSEPKSDYFVYGDLSKNSKINDFPKDIDIVVYCAGLAHINPHYCDKETVQKVNVDAVKNFAEISAENGVKRFIYISSILATPRPATGKLYIDEYAPYNDINIYSKTKIEAEKVIREVCSRYNMSFIIFRPPLVYGKGCKGNFKRLVSLIKLKIPLPFGNFCAKKSFISIQNLSKAIHCSCIQPDLYNETFVLCDDEITSTRELLINIAESLNTRLHLFSLPIIFIRSICILMGYENEINSLSNQLTLDASMFKKKTGWRPHLSQKEGIKIAVS
jgi:nucleoside-diphosphate-sugar epimerase